jgi:octaprenyl-diphosphate synthase
MTASEKNAIQKHKHLYAAELKKIDEKIIGLAAFREPIINNVVTHLINSGGKRLRPALVILSSKLCGIANDDTAHINMACCVELLHTATLFHDDVVDESELRRGAKTANEIWGNAPSVLVGDFLLAQAFYLMSVQGSMEVIDLLSSTSIKITEGEIKQLISKADIATTEERYFEIITAKTAELFAACTKIGAIITNKNADQKTALDNFGKNLGIAFQLADDGLDYSASQENLGKKIGDDFREGKITLPVIYALASATSEEKTFIENLYSDDENKSADFERSDENLAKIIQIFEKYQAAEYTIKTAQTYAEKAIATLEIFPDSEYKTALIDLCNFSVNRFF